MEKFRIVVAGGRNFHQYKLLICKLDKLLKDKKLTHEIYIISGKAPGADSLGENYAKLRGYKVKEYPAEWDNLNGVDAKFIRTNNNGQAYNVLAGHIRNEKMAMNADAAVIFWDGKSTGSKNMIEQAKKYKLIVRVVKY